MGDAPKVLVEWNFLEWDFGNETARRDYMDSDHYLYNVVAGGVRVSHKTGDVFFSAPRFHGGGAVPATVGRVTPGGARGPEGQPLARPFPSWEANDPEAEGGIRSAFGLLLDPADRLWVLDSGWVAKESGPPQLLVYADASSDRPRLLRRHIFPAVVAREGRSYMNDLTLDVETGMVYVADSATYGAGQGSLIVYDYKRDRSWLALADVVSTDAVPGLVMTLNSVPMRPNPVAGADGIALCGRTVFYTPFSGHTMYEIDASTLDNEALTPDDRNSTVRVSRLRRDFASDGIICDDRGRLWMGSMDTSAMLVWDPAGSAADPAVVTSDAATMVWPAVVGFDHAGGAFLLNFAAAGKMPIERDRVNFRVWTVSGLSAHSFMRNKRDFLDGGGASKDHVVLAVAVSLVVLFIGGAAFYFAMQSKSRGRVGSGGGGGGSSSGRDDEYYAGMLAAPDDDAGGTAYAALDE